MITNPSNTDDNNNNNNDNANNENTHVCIYIYIYKERERERELYTHRGQAGVLADALEADHGSSLRDLAEGPGVGRLVM